MVKASNAAAAKFDTMASAAMEHIASDIPNISASRPDKRPLGIGRVAVRLITASMSASYHILRAPAAPAPAAMQRRTAQSVSGSNFLGAFISPVAAVNTTSDMTRGFINTAKSASCDLLPARAIWAAWPPLVIVIFGRPIVWLELVFAPLTMRGHH